MQPCQSDKAQSYLMRVQSSDMVAHFLLVKVPLSQAMDRGDCPRSLGMGGNGMDVVGHDSSGIGFRESNSCLQSCVSITAA